MASVGRRSLVATFVLCQLLWSLATGWRMEKYCPLTSPMGTAMYISYGTSTNFADKLLSGCAAACASDPSCRCFNYNKTGQNCSLYDSEPTSTSSVSSTSPSTPQAYQLMRYPLTNVWPMVPLANCSLPFTSGGSIYYGCRLSYYQNEMTCPRWGCFLRNLTEAICQPPYDVQVVNDTTTVSLSTSPAGSGQSTTSSVTLKSISGWLIIQQRTSNNLNFEKTWTDYVNGFSDTTGDNFWLGLQKMYQLTTLAGYNRLRIEMYSALRNSWYSAEYSSFVVYANYSAKISGYVGDAGDGFKNFNSLAVSFSTWDNGTCSSVASTYKGGWWYTSSTNYYVYGNLNGNYLITPSPTKTGFFWSPASAPQNGPPSTVIETGNTDPGPLQISRMMLTKP